MKIKRDIELLAPCGSMEALWAAIQGGCNSVYFGIEQLNMRARSSVNFSLQDIEMIVAVARKHRIKSYITLNTILYDYDLSLMRQIVNEAYKVGVNAIIASDHAVMNYAKKIGMPVHISTQANITNIESIEFYAQFSDVMVMARELTLKQVGNIVKEIERRKIKGPSGALVRVEVFIHGALCMAVSGKCYLSLHSHFASANRGACVQNCRRSYIVIDKEDFSELEIENEYIMSAKDLCTIDFLDRVIDSGVSVLKIEGRGRSEEYVYTTTSVYREAIDSYGGRPHPRKKIKEWRDRLEMVFNRGFWDGYYLGRKMGEWSDEYGSKATQRKVYVGKGVKFFDKISVGEFVIESHSLKVGDKIMISGPTTGLMQGKVSELRVNDKKMSEVKKGEVVSIPVEKRIRTSDKLYKLVNV